MTNGTHTARCELFKARIKSHGGEDPIVEWSLKSGLLGFTYNGDLYRATIPGADSEVQMTERMMYSCTAMLAFIQTLQFGATWQIKRS
jgi:hypothetical protein